MTNDEQQIPGGDKEEAPRMSFQPSSRSSRRKPGPKAESELGPGFRRGERRKRPGEKEAVTLTRQMIVDVARSWIGTPYVHQASARGAGADCLGLVRGVWRELYGAEPEIPPPYTPDWNERRGDEPLLAAARRNLIERKGGAPEAGEVVVFRIDPDGPAKHCGIVTAPARFVHAYAGRQVCESWLYRWWRSRLAGIFLFPEMH